MSTYLASKPLSPEQETHLKEAEKILAAKRVKTVARWSISIVLAALALGVFLAFVLSHI